MHAHDDTRTHPLRIRGCQNTMDPTAVPSAVRGVRPLFGAARHFLNLVVADSNLYLENALTAITSLYLREIDF
jgi:hypothetical protein